MLKTHNLGMLTIHEGDAADGLKAIDRQSVNVCVTSPPYWQQRKYTDGDPRELGNEKNPADYIGRLIDIFSLVRLTLVDHGLLFVNLGDKYPYDNKWGGRSGNKNEIGQGYPRPDARSFSGIKPGDRALIPERFAIAMQEDGWYLRDVIIWRKLAAMPSSINGWRWEKCRQKVRSQSEDRPGRGEATRLARPNSGGMENVDPDFQTTWTDCSGCPKCEPNDGLVLRRGSFRTTCNFEPIYMFAKSPSYFCDREAVIEQAEESTASRNQYTRITDRADDEQYAVAHDHEFTGGTRSPRSVRDIAPDNYRGKHYAAFPREIPDFCIRMSVSERGPPADFPGVGSSNAPKTRRPPNSRARDRNGKNRTRNGVCCKTPSGLDRPPTTAAHTTTRSDRPKPLAGVPAAHATRQSRQRTCSRSVWRHGYDRRSCHQTGAPGHIVRTQPGIRRANPRADRRQTTPSSHAKF